MKINIKRFNKELSSNTQLHVFDVHNTNLLQALIEIKKEMDSTLTFRCGCKSGVCGSCAVRVNGIEKLSCKTNLNENDLVEPINNSNILKDLIVDVSHETLLISKLNLSIDTNIESTQISQEEVQTNRNIFKDKR